MEYTVKATDGHNVETVFKGEYPEALSEAMDYSLSNSLKDVLIYGNNSLIYVFRNGKRTDR